MEPPPNLQPNPSRTLRRVWGLWGTSQIVINHIATRSSPQ